MNQSLFKLEEEKSILLQATKITNEILAEIIKMAELKSLRITKSEISVSSAIFSESTKLSLLNAVQDAGNKYFSAKFTEEFNGRVKIGIETSLHLDTRFFSIKDEYDDEYDDFDNDGYEASRKEYEELKIFVETALKQIDFAKAFVEISSGIEQLVHLEELNLSGIDRLPCGISSLINLKNLTLNNNSFTEIPKEIFNLINLENLDLSHNQITRIPKELSKLNKLRYIDLSHNRITEIPKELSKLTNLRQLYISHNQITGIPKEFLKLTDINIDFNYNIFQNLTVEMVRFVKEDSYFKQSKCFYYLFDNEDTDLNKRIQKLKEEKDNYDIFNLQKLECKLYYQDSSILLIDKHNQALLLFDYDGGDYGSDLPSYKDGIFIHIFGVSAKQNNMLTSIRKNIDSWLISFNKKIIGDLKGYKKEYIPERYFIYPNSENIEEPIRIEFDKLLTCKESGENIYSGERLWDFNTQTFSDVPKFRIPVNDLLAYIGAENDNLNKTWKGTDYVTEVSIRYFKILRNIDIKLSKNINILLGNNGLGKTSILQAITLGLLPIENNDKYSDFKDFISIKNDKSEIKINWGEKENRKLFVFQKGRPVYEGYTNPHQPLLLSYGVNLNTNKEQDHGRIVTQMLDGNSDAYYTKSIFEDYVNNFHDPLIILKYLDDRIKITKNLNINGIKKRVINELNKTINTEKTKTKQIDPTTTKVVLLNHLLITTLNEYLDLIDKSEQIQITYDNQKQRYYFKDINSNTIEIQHLSEGYKDHILLITDIIVRILSARNSIFENEINIPITKDLLINTKGIILIDEFDRHLHPVWQRKLLSKFKADFPNIQFILTTHNPFSVQSAVCANAIQLKIEKGVITAKNSIIESKNILSIIHEYFTEDFFDFETQNLLKQFSNYFDKINDGEIDLVYSAEFKDIVQQICDKNDDLQSEIVSQILQLNSALKKMNKKEFAL